MTPPSKATLLQQHQALIDASAIAPTVAAARGYRSATTKVELKALGFTEAQCRVPALLIPVHGVDGEIKTYQIRPESPRIGKNGKALKYETVARSRMALDVPPPVRRQLSDPSIPLFITEGARKADAAVSKGLCCLALLGVWNWRGSNEAGGKIALPDWESIALNARKVYIAFDSDVMEKRAVHAALTRLKAFLESKKASVFLIYLPPGPAGEKVGLDDFFAAGHTVDDLLARATPDVKRLAGDGDDTGHYVVEADRICWRKSVADSVVDVALCNFEARIVAEITRDDGGGEPESVFEIAGTVARGGRLPTITVPAAEFPGMAWPMTKWGAGAIVSAGIGARDRLREAIQILSGSVPRRTVYAHTGWRRIGDEWVYLHTNGGIGAGGAVESVTVELTGALARYALPAPPAGTDRIAAVRASLALWDLAPAQVMAPLLGAVTLAPLCEPLGTDRPDVALWLYGASGVGKSELAALAQAHFGSFTRTTLPASFTATANAIERFAFTTKDALLVVDDFHPPHDQREAQMMAQVATRLVRGVGNTTGRSRMRADLRLRPDYPPRGVVLITGERLLEGHSNTARVFAVPIEKGMVNLGCLGKAQAHREALASTMAAYVQWLAARMDDLRKALPARFCALRGEAQRAAGPGHSREPGQIAHLYLGVEMLFDFAGEVGALTDRERAARLKDAWTACLANADEHALDVADEDPVARFRRLLADGFASRQIFVEAREGKELDDPGQWGWVLISRTEPSGLEYHTWQRPHAGTRVGVLDDDWLLLFPEATYRYLATAAKASGPLFPVDAKTLWRRLDEAGLIAAVKEGSERRRLPNVRLGAATTRVAKLRLEALDEAAAATGRPLGDASTRAGTGNPPNPAERHPDGTGGPDDAPEPGSFDGPEPRVPAPTGNTPTNGNGRRNRKAESHRGDSVLAPDVPAVPALYTGRERRRADVGSV